MSERATLKELEERVSRGDLQAGESLAAKLTDTLLLTRAYGLLAIAYQQRGEPAKAEQLWASALGGGGGSASAEDSTLLRLALSGENEQLFSELDEIYKPIPLAEMDYASMATSSLAAILGGDPAVVRRINRNLEKAMVAAREGDRVAALEAMSFLADRSIEKAQLLERLATMCALQGSTEQAQLLLDAAHRYPFKASQGPLHALCHAYLRKGDVDSALATLARIKKHDKYSHETRAEVILELHRRRRFEEMLRVCDGLKPGRMKDLTLLAMVEDLASGGDPMIAEVLCSKISGQTAQRSALRLTALGFQKAGLEGDAARLKSGGAPK